VHLEQQALADSEAWLARTRSFWTTQLAHLAATFQKDDS
jgi:hypothetical protein